MLVKAENLEVRGVEKKVSKRSNDEYLIVRVEDSTGKAYELLDRDVNNISYYARGIQCDMTLDLNVGRYTALNIVKMEVRG